MIESVVHSLRYLKPRVDGDFVDEISQVLTANILIMLAMATSYKTFSGRPIECLVPKMFHYALEEYSEAYCWVKDTYFLPWDKRPSEQMDERDSLRISYYQWVPFFLLVQSITFRLPGFIWKWTASHSGLNMHDYVSLSTDPQNTLLSTRQLNVLHVACHMDHALKSHRRCSKRNYAPHSRLLIWLNLPYTSSYATVMYIVSKIVQLANVVLQMFLLNSFLSSNQFQFMGWRTVYDMIKGSKWEQSGMFPRVTVCDLELRDIGQSQRFSFQCSLIINMLNEKIFIFLWLWYTSLLALTSINCLHWIVLVSVPKCNASFIDGQLATSALGSTKKSTRLRKQFLTNYLGSDGVLVLRFITAHAGVIFGSELVEQLWRQYYKLKQLERSESQIHPGIDSEESIEDRKLSRWSQISSAPTITITKVLPLQDIESGESEMDASDERTNSESDSDFDANIIFPAHRAIPSTSALTLAGRDRVPTMLLTPDPTSVLHDPLQRMERRVRLMERGHYTTHNPSHRNERKLSRIRTNRK